jgi:hypothetical protein
MFFSKPKLLSIVGLMAIPFLVSNFSCTKSTKPAASLSIVGKWRYQKEHYVVIENGKKTFDTVDSYPPTWNIFEYRADNTKVETSEDIPRIKVKEYHLVDNLLTESAGINTLPGIDTFIIPIGDNSYYLTVMKDTIILNDSSVFNIDGKTEVRRSIKTYYSKY